MEQKEVKKCSECKNMKSYTTGGDEYPAYTYIVYCDAGHWENGGKYNNYDEEVNCDEFELKSKHS